MSRIGGFSSVHAGSRESRAFPANPCSLPQFAANGPRSKEFCGRFSGTLPSGEIQADTTFFTTANVHYAAFRRCSTRFRNCFERATSSFDPSTRRRERSTAFLESAIRFLCRSSARALSVSVMGRRGMARAKSSTVRCVGPIMMRSR